MVPVAKAEFSIKFSREGGYVFEALGIKSVEFGNRLLGDCPEGEREHAHRDTAAGVRNSD